MWLKSIRLSTLTVALLFCCESGMTSMAAQHDDTAPSSLQEQKLPRLGEGKASYYAERFHGRKTASGERFSKEEFTAAHRTLPFGTTLRVTNTDNGKTVLVRVNDRGPHCGNRIIDLSPAAARAIGLMGKGTGNVRIERLTPPLCSRKTCARKANTYTPLVTGSAHEVREESESATS